MSAKQLKTKKVNPIGRPRKYSAKSKVVNVSIPLVTHQKHTWQAYAHAIGQSMTDLVIDAVTTYITDEKNIEKVTTKYKENVKRFDKNKAADLAE